MKPRCNQVHRDHRGQSTVEYVVVCAVLVITLGLGMTNDHGVIRQLLDAFAEGYQKISFALSLP